MNILVTARAGSIVSATAEVLLKAGHPVTVYDSFVTVHELPSRPGDSSEKSKQELGWKPEHDTLKEIISSVWQWHKSHPKGYTE